MFRNKTQYQLVRYRVKLDGISASLFSDFLIDMKVGRTTPDQLIRTALRTVGMKGAEYHKTSAPVGQVRAEIYEGGSLLIEKVV